MHKIALIYTLFNTIAKKRDNKSSCSTKEPKYKNIEVKSVEDYIAKECIYKNCIKNIFEFFRQYDFKNISSINKNYDAHLKNRFNSFTILENISLYEHSLNTSLEVIKLTKNRPNSFKSIALLLALLHDVGKHPEIEKKYRKNTQETHDKISANFAKYFLIEQVGFEKNLTFETIETIYNTLRVHHEQTEQESAFLQVLKKADFNARDKEIKIQLLSRRVENDS